VTRKDRIMSKYYHLTSNENAKKILKEGLRPIHGENSAAISDKREGVFLCKKDDIPYWKIILDLPVILEVDDIEDDNVEIYKYTLYSEYVYPNVITFEKIKEVCLDIDIKNAMHNLCIDYLYIFSRFTVQCARYYDYRNKDLHDALILSADSLISVMYNLDYTSCDKKEIMAELKEIGEIGDYSFLDMYYTTGRRLYQQLILYPQDDLTERRREIYRYLKKYLKGCISVNTGGYCG
jgi:hypothetical protein